MGMIDSDLKDYLKVQFDAIIAKIDDLKGSTEKEIERHRKDLDDLYDKDRDSKERIRDLESFRTNHIDLHDDKKDNKKFSIEMWVVIGIFLVSTIIGYFK